MKPLANLTAVLATVLATALASLLLAGCGSGDPSVNADPAPVGGVGLTPTTAQPKSDMGGNSMGSVNGPSSGRR